MNKMLKSIAVVILFSVVMSESSIAENVLTERKEPMETSGKRFKLFVRVYNDGVAIRYSIPEGTKRINGESTSWNISENVSKIAWSEYNPDYEGLSYVNSFDKVAENRIVMPPITVEDEGY